MDEKRSAYMTQYVSARGLLRKIKAVAHKGGKCQKCGYDKCVNALEFHHRDPTSKEVDWRKMQRRSWAGVKEELDKCDLLCANCHREVHYDPEVLKRATEFWDSRKRPVKIDHHCATCKAKFSPKGKAKKYCGYKCARASQVKVEWPLDLPILVGTSSLSAVGRILGVSVAAVRKRLKNHHNAVEAQLVEQPPLKRTGAGSTPASGT